MVLLIPLCGVFLLHPQPTPRRFGPGLLPTSPRGTLAFPWLLAAPMGACGYLIHICLSSWTADSIKAMAMSVLFLVVPGAWAVVGAQDSMTGPHPLSPHSLVLTFSRYLPPLSLRTLPPLPPHPSSSFSSSTHPEEPSSRERSFMVTLIPGLTVTILRLERAPLAIPSGIVLSCLCCLCHSPLCSTPAPHTTDTSLTKFHSPHLGPLLSPDMPCTVVLGPQVLEQGPPRICDFLKPSSAPAEVHPFWSFLRKVQPGFVCWIRLIRAIGS